MARSVRAGYLSRRIEAMRARGLTRGQIARETGIGERTQRKVRSGETSGVRLFRRQQEAATRIPRSSEPGHYALVVQRPDGSFRRVSVVLPDYARRRRLTPLDKAVILSAPGTEQAISHELARGTKSTGPWSPAEIEEASAVDVVPLIAPHTTDIPWVEIGQ